MTATTEANIETQWKAAIDVLENLRVHADDTQAATSGKLRTLEESLIGEFTPAIANAAAEFRGLISAALDRNMVRAFLDPIIFEYGKFIDSQTGSFGAAYSSPEKILETMYEYFGTSKQLEHRNITRPTPAKISGTGTSSIRRLTIDEGGFPLEACTVEKKHFRCRQDANSGAEAEAEIFEHIGQAASKDNLLKGSTGSGTRFNFPIYSKNAGGGQGGSLLNNSSFSDFTASATSLEQFNGWTETFRGSSVYGDITQTVLAAESYRQYPGSQTSGSLELLCESSSDGIILSQSIDDMATDQLRTDRPYFLRAMVRKDHPSKTDAAEGTFKMRLGSREVTQAISGMATGWVEIIIPLDANCWFANFNQDETVASQGLVEIEWNAGTAGTLLVDDVILCEMVLIDGTYWLLTQKHASPVRPLVDLLLTVTDSNTVSDGKLQYYLNLGYGRYLPADGSPTITDP